MGPIYLIYAFSRAIILTSKARLQILLISSLVLMGSLQNPCFPQLFEDVTSSLFQPIPSKRVCQDKTYEFKIQYRNGDLISPRQLTRYYRQVGASNICQFVLDKEEVNNSLKLFGPGISIQDFVYVPQAPNGARAYWYTNVKFNSTGPITVGWEDRDIFPENSCGNKSTTKAYVGTYDIITSIPTPPKPTLTSQKAVVRSPESTTISCSFCPNSIVSNARGITELAYDCGSDGKLLFAAISGGGNTDNSTYFPFRTDFPYYKPGTVFYARCNDNGCLSEVSAPLAIGVQSSAPNCGDEKMNEIDSYTNDGRPDYHHYTQETVICNKADGNPNCTKQKVFELMKSRKDNNVFTAADEHIDGAFPVGRNFLKTQVQLLGSDMVFHIPETPVNNCDPFNLISNVSVLMNLITLKAAIAYDRLLPVALLSQNASLAPSLPLGNPIAQVIDEASSSITNYTRFGHILYPGKVVRTVVEQCGQIKIVTIGTGRHWIADTGPLISAIMRDPLAGPFIARDLGAYMSNENSEVGKQLFSDVDIRVKVEFNKLPR